MFVSVIVCTWNRSAMLARGLATLEGLSVPAGCEWELVVVDNGSTDETAGVLDGFVDRLPLRVVREPRLGVSRARNAGVEAARGELLLFTDDDTRVEPGWLAAYVAAAERWPDAGYFGGRVEADFATPPPRWVAANVGALSPMLCTVDIRGDERPMEPGAQPFGPNMAFRRATLDGVRFDEALGRRGTEQVRGSEVSVVNELRRRGASGVWVPAARVGHVVAAEHMTLRYLWRYHEGAGVAAVRLSTGQSVGQSPEQSAEQSVGVSTSYRIGKGLAAAWLKLIVGRSDWVVHLGRAAHYVGVRRETRRQAKELA